MIFRDHFSAEVKFLAETLVNSEVIVNKNIIILTVFLENVD